MKKTLLFLALCVTLTASANEVTGTVTKVYDGDTATIAVNGAAIKCRFKGIDAPELKQEYGLESRRFLADLILNKEVTVRIHGTDRYQRSVCEVFLKSASVNKLMVLSGRAWWYVAYDKKDFVMRNAEQAAKDQKLGLWSNENSIAPWDWRKQSKSKVK